MQTFEMFDFNAIEKPVMPVKLGQGADETVVHLSYPSVELLDRLTSMADELPAIVEKKNGYTIRATFGVVAEVLSCNEDGFTFTAEELRDKYRMTLLGVARFTAQYFEFIKKANDAKN